MPVEKITVKDRPPPPGITVIENPPETEPQNVLRRDDLEFKISTPYEKVIIDRNMQAFANRNSIPYERRTRDLTWYENILYSYFSLEPIKAIT